MFLGHNRVSIFHAKYRLFDVVELFLVCFGKERPDDLGHVFPMLALCVNSGPGKSFHDIGLALGVI